MRLLLPAVMLVTVLGCGSASTPTDTAARVHCDPDDARPRCELLRVHARAVQLQEDLVTARASCRRAGDDIRLSCVQTLTHRADELELVLSDYTRADRDPNVVLLGDQYVGALEATFRERCLGGAAPACGLPDRFVARN